MTPTDARFHGCQIARSSRVAARTETIAEAIKIGNEVETLYTNGPAGGGGAWKSARPVVSMASALIPETVVEPRVTVLGG
jgi:hypothetical protein